MVKYLVSILLLWSVAGYSQTIQYADVAFHSFEGEVIRSYYVNPLDPATIIIGTKGNQEGTGKIYRSQNHGESWTPLNGGKPLSKACEDIQTVSMVSEKIILAGSWKNGMFISKDGGKQFKPVKNCPASDIRSIQASGSGKIFAATTTHGILVSEDEGENWVTAHAEGMSKKLASWKIAIHPGSKNIIYALTFNHGIYKSIDAGKNWKQVLREDGLMFWDIDFTMNKIFVVGSNDSVSYLYSSYMGDNKWKAELLNIPSAVNSMNILRGFTDYYYLFGTWGAGMYKSYAIESSVSGYRCIELEKEDTIGVMDVYSDEKNIYNFSWGNGVKILEREDECQIVIPKSLKNSNKSNLDWGIRNSCDVNYFHFKLYSRWGEIIFEKTDNIPNVNAALKSEIENLKKEEHIYWMKFSFQNEKDTLDLKGRISIDD